MLRPAHRWLPGTWIMIIWLATAQRVHAADWFDFIETIRQATELETIVRRLESGEIALEDSIAAYERGAALKTHCAKKLAEAQAKIEKITVNKDGSVTTEPLDSKN